MTTDATRIEVRKAALTFLVATLAVCATVLLGANLPVVFAVAAIVTVATFSGIPILLGQRMPRTTGQVVRWTLLMVLGVSIGFHLARAWFPWTEYFCIGPEDGGMIDGYSIVECDGIVDVDVPGNAARTVVTAGAIGLVAWLVALILPLGRIPVLARIETWGSEQDHREIAPVEGGDLGLFVLAIATVVVPPMAAMDALTWPFAWPWVQVAAAFLLTLPLIKKRSIFGALVVYRITFVAYALLFARLVLGAAPTLTTTERAVLGVAIVGVLAVSAFAHHRTGRLRAETPLGVLP